MGIDALISRMATDLAALETEGDPRRHFHGVYLRTTVAVGKALHDGKFLDPDWVERWDVAFAELYLDALDAARAGQAPSRPWQVVFAALSADPSLPPLRCVLLGMDAHINADLAQSLVRGIDTGDFDDPLLLARRKADHRTIDEVLAHRVASEDTVLAASGGRRLLDHLLTPVNRAATRRFLAESRRRVWANAVQLDQARRQGPDVYAARVRELEDLSAAKTAELLRPGQVVLRAAVHGFGVDLPPSGPGAAATAGSQLAPGPLRTFDPVRVGRLERDAWAAYYRHEWVRALRAFVGLVRAAFGFGPVGTLRGAWAILRANQLWAPYPENDPAGARRQMARFYRLVSRTYGEPADPERCAELEIAWWRAHREKQREDGRREPVVACVMDLWAEVYRVRAEAVGAAAEARADAMTASDAWVDAGCRADDPLLEVERAALVRCYAALLAAVHRPPGS